MLVAALRGDPGVWRELDDTVRQQRFIEGAAAHRVKPLLVWTLLRSGELQRYPDLVRAALLGAARAEGALEVARELNLHRVLSVLSSARIDALVIKGAALAYTIYPEPWLRPREDTDLLVRAEDAARAGALLDAAGYRRVVRQSGRLVTNQQLYVRAASPHRDAIDLHWKIADPAPFADLISSGDLFSSAIEAPLPTSGIVRVPSRGHALLLACWHRVAHHRDTERLLWLYDIHILADGLDAAERRVVVQVAQRTRTMDVCAAALTLAAGHFRSAGAAALAEELARVTGPSGAASRYLRADARKVDLLVADLQALPGWRTRAQLLREHLFPPAAYMRETYPSSSPLLLPFLYARRIVGGARRWLSRPRQPRPSRRHREAREVREDHEG